MKGYTAVLPSGEAISYVDHKRWFWILSVLFPLLPFVGIALHWQKGGELWLLFPLLINYVIVPAVDMVLGEDRNNPPEEFAHQLNQDLYYRRLTFITVPMHFITLFGCAWYASTQDLSWLGFGYVALIAGLTAGLAINTGHELGHKNSQFEKMLAKVALAIPAYPHFCIDHNRGHHRDVSTPNDPASARMGESIYRFAAREIPHTFVRAWQIEKDRLQRRDKSVWSADNQILQSLAISVAIWLLLFALFGWVMVPFILIHNALAYWQLTSANYIEHYGLLRSKDENGKYERCVPHHSWNSNHTFSNLVLFHLQRHSDHHTHPLRRYQALRHFEKLPTLPNGYLGMYLVAYVPQLWFWMMDKRLLALPHVQGDLDKINIDPAAKPAIFLKYGRDKMAEPTIIEKIDIKEFQDE